MKRKLKILVALVLSLVLLPLVIEAAHVAPVIGYGLILEHGSKAATATIVGGGFDVLTKDSAGFTLVLEPTYIHTKVAGVERQIARGFLLGRKQLCTDKFSRFWRYFFFESGVGGWTVLSSGDDDDEDAGATFRVIYDTGGVKAKIGLDVIDVSVGRNLYMPFVSVQLGF